MIDQDKDLKIVYLIQVRADSENIMVGSAYYIRLNQVKNYINPVLQNFKIPIIVEVIDDINKLDDDFSKINLFYHLMYYIKGTELMNTKYSIIEIEFDNLLNLLYKMDNEKSKRDSLSALIS